MKCSVYIVCPSVLNRSNLKLHQTLEVKNILIHNIMLQLTFNSGLTLTSFQTTRPWVKRGTVRVNCLAQEHSTTSRLGLEPRPLDQESSALITSPPPKGILHQKGFSLTRRNQEKTKEVYSFYIHLLVKQVHYLLQDFVCYLDSKCSACSLYKSLAKSFIVNSITYYNTLVTTYLSSEVLTRKSQTKILPCNTERQRFEIFP